MIAAQDLPITSLHWSNGVRIIRSVYPPIDLFEDIADPEDWPLLISAEQKTNPRLMETIGQLDLVPPERRVAGPGASLLMASFTHTSPDRPSRFSDGRLGVLYVASDFETAVAETIHHHGKFMLMTAQPEGWTSQFRELHLEVDAELYDIRGLGGQAHPWLMPDDYRDSNRLGAELRTLDGQGIVYPSVRSDGDCVGLFFPDLARPPRQGRHLDYHWNGARVDLIRDAGSGEVFRVS